MNVLKPPTFVLLAIDLIVKTLKDPTCVFHVKIWIHKHGHTSEETTAVYEVRMLFFFVSDSGYILESKSI